METRPRSASWGSGNRPSITSAASQWPLGQPQRSLNHHPLEVQRPHLLTKQIRLMRKGVKIQVVKSFLSYGRDEISHKDLLVNINGSDSQVSLAATNKLTLFLLGGILLGPNDLKQSGISTVLWLESPKFMTLFISVSVWSQ